MQCRTIRRVTSENVVDPGRQPCIIGTARRTWHPGDGAPDPLSMMAEIARSAAADVTGRALPDVVGAIDHLAVVHCQSWSAPEPSAHVATELGIASERLRRTDSIVAGTSHQRLLDAAAEEMIAGRSEVALVVGAEALATVKRHRRSGETPPWEIGAGPPVMPIDVNEWYLPTELAHGVLPAWLTFVLLGEARWAARGARPEDRADAAALFARFSQVAAANEGAWFRRAYSADEVATPTADNRMVSSPWTKRMMAFPDVDMAAANLLVTRDVADRWGVPDEQRVYLRGFGFARDAVHIAGRADMAGSPAMRMATTEALEMAGLGLDDVDAFDLYSCFPSAVLFARDALGVEADDPRPLSLTGGLPYHGGPNSNYMGHSISHAVDLIRSGAATTVMTTGVGMHMTKHVAGVWSREPGPMRRPTAPRTDWPTTEVDVVAEARGPCTVVSATVIHGSDGEPSHVVAICDLPDGSRCYARSDDRSTIDAVLNGEWVKATGHLSAGAGSTNTLTL